MSGGRVWPFACLCGTWRLAPRNRIFSCGRLSPVLAPILALISAPMGFWVLFPRDRKRVRACWDNHGNVTAYKTSFFQRTTWQPGDKSQNNKKAIVLDLCLLVPWPRNSAFARQSHDATGEWCILEVNCGDPALRMGWAAKPKTWNRSGSFCNDGVGHEIAKS